MRIVRSFVLAVLVTAGWGCSTFKEIHYFKDEAPSFPNYYRLKVKGWTFFTSSRYTSGYFDEEAVNEYFSEVQQAKRDDSSDEAKSADENGQVLHPIGTNREGKKLVMILSSHSGAVASQIGSYVENENTMNAIAQLVNRGRRHEELKIELSTQMEDFHQKLLLDKGNRLIAELNLASITAEEARTQLLDYVNALAQYLGHTESFSRLEDAKVWFNYNRGRLLNAKN